MDTIEIAVIFTARTAEKEARRQALVLKLWEAYDLADDGAVQCAIVLALARIAD